MNLIAKLTEEIVEGSTSLSTALRRAKLLAAELDLPEFKAWIDHELNGYPSPSDVPEYRDLHGSYAGTFSGTFGRVTSNVPLPLVSVEPWLRERITQHKSTQSVAEIEQLIKSASAKEGGALGQRWPAEWVMVARNGMQMDDGSVLVDARTTIDVAQFVGILDNVRNRTLDFIIKLKELVPAIQQSDAAIATLRGEDVRKAYQVTILGNNNVVATGHDITQEVRQSPVVRGDIESLIAHIRQLGVTDAQIRELRSAINQDGEVKGEDIGPGVTNWLGRMAAAAAKGIWKAGMGIGTSILTKALFRYYGLET